MKTLLLSGGILVAALATGKPASAAAVEICGATACVPPSPASVAAAGVAVAFGVEKRCREDRESSCTEQAKKAGQNTIDYVRGKRNLLKSVGKRLKKIF